MSASGYLIKKALGGSPISAYLNQAFLDKMPKVWSSEDQKTVDGFALNLPPSRRKGPLGAGLQRLIARKG